MRNAFRLLGVTFPLYSTAIQNVVPLRKMGVAISAVPFWRFMGGALGLAVLGSLVTNTFATDFLARLPQSVKQAIPLSVLNSLAHNPHGLISQEQLKNLLASFVSNPDQVLAQVLDALRYSLNSAITAAIFISFATVIVTLVIQLFIKEVPLRHKYISEPPSDNP